MYFFIVAFFVSGQFINASSPQPYETPYAQEAAEWVVTYVQNLPREDLTLVLNFVYLSWARSNVTIGTQTQMHEIELLENQMHHLFARTRLNPGIYTQESMPSHLESHYKAYITSLYNHQEIALAYNAAATSCIDNGALIIGKGALLVLRKNARAAIAKAFITKAKNLVHQITSAQKKVGQSAGLFNLIKPFEIRSIKLKHILSIFTNTFARTDSSYNKAEYVLSSALLTAREKYNTIWKTIEEVRMSFYEAHYTALYNYMQTIGGDQEMFCLVFDKNGLDREACKLLPPALSDNP